VKHRLLNIGVAAITAVFAATFVTASSAPVTSALAGSLPTVRSNCMVNVSPWIQTLDPAVNYDVNSSCFIQRYAGQLVKLLPNGKVGPELASSSKLSENHLTWTFTLRKGLHFYDGHPVTASDFLWDMARAALPALKLPVTAYYDGFIKGINAVAGGPNSETMSQAISTLSSGIKVNNAKRTIAITTTTPTPFFLSAFTYPTTSLLDPAAVPNPLTAADNSSYLTDNCDGANANATGPFIFKCTASGSDPINHHNFYTGSPAITMVPNRAYYAAKAQVNVTDPQIADTDTAYSTYLSGALDVAVIPSAHISADKASPPELRGYAI
jgi:ABC-type transport system substrate-binding protein